MAPSTLIAEVKVETPLMREALAAVREMRYVNEDVNLPGEAGPRGRATRARRA